MIVLISSLFSRLVLQSWRSSVVNHHKTSAVLRPVSHVLFVLICLLQKDWNSTPFTDRKSYPFFVCESLCVCHEADIWLIFAGSLHNREDHHKTKCEFSLTVEICYFADTSVIQGTTQGQSTHDCVQNERTVIIGMLEIIIGILDWKLGTVFTIRIFVG